jgi:hypothetical protein
VKGVGKRDAEPEFAEDGMKEGEMEVGEEEAEKWE